MSKHTPTPWVVKGEGDLLCVTDADSAYVVDRFRCGVRTPEEHLANAHLIVRAVNAHERLLAVAKRSLDLFRFRLDMADISDDEKQHLDELRAAMALAKE